MQLIKKMENLEDLDKVFRQQIHICQELLEQDNQGMYLLQNKLFDNTENAVIKTVFFNFLFLINFFFNF